MPVPAAFASPATEMKYVPGDAGVNVSLVSESRPSSHVSVPATGVPSASWTRSRTGPRKVQSAAGAGAEHLDHIGAARDQLSCEPVRVPQAEAVADRAKRSRIGRHQRPPCRCPPTAHRRRALNGLHDPQTPSRRPQQTRRTRQTSRRAGPAGRRPGSVDTGSTTTGSSICCCWSSP